MDSLTCSSHQSSFISKSEYELTQFSNPWKWSCNHPQYLSLLLPFFLLFSPLCHFLSRLTQAASATWDQLKSQTAAGLQEALKNRKQLEVAITLQSPYLLVPEKGRYTKNSNLLVVDLGKLSVFGSTKDPKSILVSEGYDTKATWAFISNGLHKSLY